MVWWVFLNIYATFLSPYVNSRQLLHVCYSFIKRHPDFNWSNPQRKWTVWKQVIVYMCWYEFLNHGMSGWAFFLIFISFLWDIIFFKYEFISNVDKFVITIWTFYHGYRKEWKPGFKECAMLRRQMYIPQSTQRYVNVLSNESVIKGLWQKSLYWKLKTY